LVAANSSPWCLIDAAASIELRKLNIAPGVKLFVVGVGDDENDIWWPARDDRCGGGGGDEAVGMLLTVDEPTGGGDDEDTAAVMCGGDEAWWCRGGEYGLWWPELSNIPRLHTRTRSCEVNIKSTWRH
jgi:hypothetical protein